MNDGRWIALSQEEVAPSTHPVDAKWVLESPSMYEIPSHMRATYDASTGLLKIEFRYLETERGEDFILSGYAKASVGVRSKRILAIEFDIHRYNKDRKRIAQEAETSISMVSSARMQNRAITSRAVQVKGENLFSSKVLSL